MKRYCYKLNDIYPKTSSLLFIVWFEVINFINFLDQQNNQTKKKVKKI